MTPKLIAPLRQIFVTQTFGGNRLMYAIYGLKGHNGIDFRTRFMLPDYQTPNGHMHVFPMAAGRVVEVGDQDIHRPGKPVEGIGYGKFIRIDHPDGSQTVYGHLKSQYVKRGQQVTTDTVIGLTDNTGKSTGSHLHAGYRPPMWQEIYDNGFKGYINFLPFLIKRV